MPYPSAVIRLAILALALGLVCAALLVWTITISILTPASLYSVASRPAGADKTFIGKRH